MNVSIGMHRRQAVRHVVVVQGHHGELAGLFVLMRGGHRLVRVAIAEAELPAADIATREGNHAKGLAACALATLARHHQ
ncbi:hypothetical protein D3C85_1398270 [compost metagenome]